jgi:hypothetical protein
MFFDLLPFVWVNSPRRVVPGDCGERHNPRAGRARASRPMHAPVHVHRRLKAVPRPLLLLLRTKANRPSPPRRHRCAGEQPRRVSAPRGCGSRTHERENYSYFDEGLARKGCFV